LKKYTVLGILFFYFNSRYAELKHDISMRFFCAHYDAKKYVQQIIKTAGKSSGNF